jgi:hypothetical protein
MVAILTGMRWNLNLVLICISLRPNLKVKFIFHKGFPDSNDRKYMLLPLFVYLDLSLTIRISYIFLQGIHI